jgi:hypothetical protein
VILRAAVAAALRQTAFQLGVHIAIWAALSVAASHTAAVLARRGRRVSRTPSAPATSSRSWRVPRSPPSGVW